MPDSITIESESLQASESQLCNRLRRDEFVVSKQILSDGATSVVRGEGSDDNAAVAAAGATVPPGAEIIATTIVRPAQSNVTTVVFADDEETARGLDIVTPHQPP